MSKNKVLQVYLQNFTKSKNIILSLQVIKMIVRQMYLNRLIEAKDTEFIKVITSVRRSGKSTLLLMFKDYLIENNISKESIIHINFESTIYDDIKDYKDLYNYIKSNISANKTYILLDEVQNIESWAKGVNSLKVDFDVDIYNRF